MNWSALNLRQILMFVIVVCSLLGSASLQAQQTISYPNFNSTTGLRLNGSATTAPGANGQVLRLTPAQLSQSGTVWFANTLALKNGFSTTFTFQFSGFAAGNAADGIAFVLQNGAFGNGLAGSQAWDPSEGGGGIGYQGLTRSLAVEFDTWYNGVNNDIPSNTQYVITASSNEIAIQSCGTLANTAIHGSCTIGGPFDPAQGKTSPAINLTDGLPHTAVVTYTPPCVVDVCANLTVTLDGQLMIAVPYDLVVMELGGNDDAFVGFTGGTGAAFENQDILSWSMTTTQSQQTGTPINNNPTQTFVFNSTANQVDAYIADYSNAQGTIIANPDATPIVTNLEITPSDWSNYVANTPFATTQCIPIIGAHGNCAIKRQLCTTPLLTTPAGANCPQSSVRNILLSGFFDANGYPAGTVFGVAEGNDTWTGGVCSFGPGSPDVNKFCPLNGLVSFTGPGGFTGTKGAQSTNSSYVFYSNLNSPTTSVSGFVNGAGWVSTKNSTPVTGTLTAVPPSVPNPNTNNMVVAPIDSITYGINPASGGLPSTLLPVAGDLTVFNPSASPIILYSANSAPATSSTCPSWPSATGAPIFSTSAPTFATPVNLGVLAEGSYLLHYFTRDCVETEDLKFTVDSSNPPVWSTSFNSLTINVDNNPPAITAGVSGNRVLNGSAPMLNFTCADPAVANLASPSGIQVCGLTPTANVPAGNLGNASFSGSSGPLSTAAVGQKLLTVYSQDRAGNKSSRNVSYSIVYGTGSCDGQPGHQILAPISLGSGKWGVFKKGKSIPAKFRVCDSNGVSIGTSGVVTGIKVQSNSGTDAETPDDTGDLLEDTNFHFDSVNQWWICNIPTRSLQSSVTYYYTVTLNDGSAIQFHFGIK